MNSQPDIVSTEADTLMSLLKEVKEISIAEAGKRLGISSEVIESWANFLEEEGVLSIKYNFTTPFLVYKAPPKETAKHVEVAEEPSQQAIDELQGFVSGIRESADITGIHQRVVELMERARESNELSEEKAVAVDSMLSRAESLLGEHKVSEAVNLYNKITLELKSLPENSTIIPEQQPSEKPQKAEFTSNVKILLAEAYKAMREDRFDDAKKTYNQIKDLYYDLPREYGSRKHLLEQDLVKLNKDLSSRIGDYSYRELTSGSAKIKDLLQKGQAQLKKDDIKGAEETYFSIRQIFDKIPDDFRKDRQALQSEIIRFYDSFSERKKITLTNDFSNKSRQISEMLSQLMNSIGTKDISQATDLYKSLRELFQKLPEGFSSEKVLLQNKILEVYSKLASAYTELAVQEMHRKSGEIGKMIEQMGKDVLANEFKQAEKTYEQIKESYSRLPEGFLAENTQLQSKILGSYARMISKSEEYSAKEFAERVADINRFVSEVQSFIMRKDYELAAELYGAIAQAYNDLPPGFLHEKASLHVKILNLYREIMLNIDSQALRSAGDVTKQNYREILKLMINIREHVAKQELSVIETSYTKARQLFDELPVGFVQQKTKLREDLLLMGYELSLYKKAIELQRKCEERNLEGMKQLIEEVSSDSQRLAAAAPEDKPLFDFIEQKCRHGRELLGEKLAPLPIDSKKTADEKFEKDFSELSSKIRQLKSTASPGIKALH